MHFNKPQYEVRLTVATKNRISEIPMQVYPFLTHNFTIKIFSITAGNSSIVYCTTHTFTIIRAHSGAPQRIVVGQDQGHWKEKVLLL